VDVRWRFALSPKVWTTDTTPGRKPFSFTVAAALSSFTVCATFGLSLYGP
jgi:hypothetical protein